MICVIFRIFTVFAELRVQSPDSLKNLEMNIQIASFGNPSLYSRYGKIHVYDNCDFEDELDFESIVLLTNSTFTCIAECAVRVESKGGRGLMVVQDQPFFIENQCQVEDSSIFTLGVTRTVYENHLKKHKDVWVTYKYELFESFNPYVEVLLSGNFSKDYELIDHIYRLNLKIPISWETIRFQLLCESNSSNTSQHCLTTPSKTMICLNTSEDLSGKSILETYSMILNVYEQLDSPDPTTTYLKYLKAVLGNCDTESNCTSRYSKGYVPNFYFDKGVLDRYGLLEKRRAGVSVNNVDIIWLDYLEPAYCLSFSDPPSTCQECSQGCPFSEIRSGNCSIWCDNEDCGFSNLACLEQNGCFNFMINDGNCNEVCFGDPDCTDDGEYIKFFIYTVLACCIVVFVVFFGSSLVALCKKQDPSLLADQIKSTCELELRSQQIEDIQVRMCPLDMAEINKNEAFVTTPCDHAFHLDCVKKLLEDDGLLKECPCCKEELKDFKVMT